MIPVRIIRFYFWYLLYIALHAAFPDRRRIRLQLQGFLFLCFSADMKVCCFFLLLSNMFLRIIYDRIHILNQSLLLLPDLVGYPLLPANYITDKFHYIFFWRFDISDCLALVSCRKFLRYYMVFLSMKHFLLLHIVFHIFG